MTKLGYGGAIEDLYLKAYRLSTEGKNVLLFHFESETKQFIKMLGSHLLQTPISVLEETDPDLRKQLKAINQNKNGKFFHVNVASLDNQEIELYILRNMKEEITDVFIDRVLKGDKQKIEAIARKYNVKLHCIVTDY